MAAPPGAGPGRGHLGLGAPPQLAPGAGPARGPGLVTGPGDQYGRPLRTLAGDVIAIGAAAVAAPGPARRAARSGDDLRARGPGAAWGTDARPAARLDGDGPAQLVCRLRTARPALPGGRPGPSGP